MIVILCRVRQVVLGLSIECFYLDKDNHDAND